MFLRNKRLFHSTLLSLALCSTPLLAAEPCADYVQQTSTALVRFASASLQPALAFSDANTATAALKPFAELSWVRYVYVFDEKNTPFAHYLAAGENAALVAEQALAARENDKSGIGLIQHTITTTNEAGEVVTLGYIVLATR